MSLGTNSKIKANNKQVEKQYKYDRSLHDYTNLTNERRFEKAKADTKLQQANLDAVARVKDQIARQDYQYQSDLQKRQFSLDKQAYRQSLKDYDKQTELNSMSGAIALESAQRAKKEALISKRFNLKDQALNFRDEKSQLKQERGLLNLGFKDEQSQLKAERGLLDSGFTYAKESRDISRGSISSKKKTAKALTKQDKKENLAQQGFVTKSGQESQKKFEYAADKLDNDINFIDSSAGWDIKAAQAAYDKQQVPNFNKRISAIIEREKAVGTARASGREGLSAEREQSSALAEYGRSQAQLVDELVFAKEDKELADSKITGTKKYQKKSKQKDKQINKADKKIDKLTTSRQLSRLKIEDSKLDIALNETLTQLGFDRQRVDSTFRKEKRDYKISSKRLTDKEKFSAKRYQINSERLDDKASLSKQRNELSKSKIKTSFDSAKLQFKADQNKIKLDEYAANLRAQGQVLQRPKKPVPLPVPYKTPVSKLPMPDAPIRAPKPIKGALGKTSIWNDVGDVANVGLQVAGLFL